ncbi:probable serine/threonine-protein kinase DDB_G0288147 [Vanessa atalanta]|uniref:probable serine/threonine-protein kinase DDB_G0288147 n=1 Tax=Vanessa atalanta TaxID=42275 RepID=UPI001FCD0CD1|nr:probable serine/threonine-protein kinase DDB_G0288147 [Vanessa atalanta]
MYKLICILKCLTLVATNPLQGLQSCPQVKYVQNYGQLDGPLITPTNYKPYQQQLMVQNQITPTIQTIPYLHDEQISRLYYKVQPSPTVNAFADVNTRVYDQNGIEIARYVPNPAGAAPNVVNNYIIVPPEYFKLNQSIHNENVFYPYQKKGLVDDDIKNNDYTEKENHKKNKRNEHSFEKHAYIDNDNNDKPTSDKQSNDVPKKKAKRKGSKINKNKRKSSKKNKNKGEELESPKVIDDDVVPDKQRTQHSKVKALENKNDKEIEENRESKTKRRKSDDSSNKVNKKSEKKKKVKPTQEKSMDSQPKEDLQDDVNLNISPNEITKKTADVDVCFDINEECADLESRRTRNNCYDRKCNNNNHHHNYHNNNQQNVQRDCPANIASYLNSIMSMPQLNTNYFNPMGNFPYNFNYLYQIPPQSNSRSNESNKKRKKGKKKQKTNNSTKDEKQCTNQNQVEELTSDDCEKVVELTPQFIEIEPINEAIISEETSQNVERNEDKTVKDSKKKDFEKEIRVIEPIENNKPRIIELSPELIEPPPELIELPLEVNEPPAEIIEPLPEIIKHPSEIIKPSNIYINDDSADTLYVAPVLGPDENLYPPMIGDEDIPFFDDNDVFDEYYPDFTSDNIYLSKEDYESNNFHDRYYYASDNKAEISREKRKYEHVKGKKMRKSDDAHNNKQKIKNTKDKKFTQQHKDTSKDKETSSEVKFRIPPPLEFPDFKTEMVNKDRDDPRIQYEHNKNGRKNDVFRDDDHDNQVETVFAHSKVVKYGAPPNTKETALFDLAPTNIDDDEKILFSRDGDTTVVIARSLGYPDDYY